MIDIALYVGGNRVITPTAIQGETFSHSRRGPQSLSAFIPGDLEQSFAIRNAPGIAELIATADGGDIWRGRVEDRQITRGGLRMTAYGYSRAFDDVPYTALWSDTSTRDWEEVSPIEAAGSKPARYKTDNNKRLSIALVKGAVYQNTTDTCEWTYVAPHRGSRLLVAFSASYATNLPTNWQIRLIRCDDDYTNQSVIQTITGNGSEQSGTITQTFGGKSRLLVQVRNNTGSAYTVTAETGDLHATLTGLRVKTTTSSTVLASDIALALYDYVNIANPGQLTGRLITATTTDLNDELYEDELPADILDYLATREGYDWGVDVNGVFYFHPRGTYARTWYVDTADVQLEESINELTNSTYAIYKDANGRTRRTTVVADATSIHVSGLTRRKPVRARTTSATEAGAWRTAALADGLAYARRVTVTADRIIDMAGQMRKGYEVQAGDTLIIRNLPQTLAPYIDVLSRIIVARVQYDWATGAVTIETDAPVPTLVTLVARRR